MASVGSPVASTFRTARSASESPPITRAWKLRVGDSVVVTVIRCAPSTTWKLVTMMPSDRMMNPVPTPRPGVCPPNGLFSSRFVVTFTTAGRALCTTWTTGSAFGSRLSGAEDGSGAGLTDEVGWGVGVSADGDGDVEAARTEFQEGTLTPFPDVPSEAQPVATTASTATPIANRFIVVMFAAREVGVGNFSECSGTPYPRLSARLGSCRIATTGDSAGRSEGVRGID